MILGWIGVSQAQIPDTTGPAILSRYGALGYTGGERGGFARLRAFLTLSGTWTHGLAPIGLDAEGRSISNETYGASASAGVSGYHAWRRSILGVHYLANYNHFGRYSKYDGINHVLSLGYTRQQTRRVAISFNESAGSYAQGAGVLTPAVYLDPDFAVVPTNEVFDARVHYLSSSADVTYHKSARWSFNFGGFGSVVKRNASSFGGLQAYGGRADMSYRLSRNQTISVLYSFQHYDFTKQFGASDVHGAVVAYGRSLGRRWRMSVGAGSFRSESLFARQVQLDPVVAAILGRATGVEAFYGINYGTTAHVSLSRGFRRSSLALFYSRGVSPGNGYYLTSQYESGGVSTSYTGLRRVSFSFFANYTSFRSLTRSLRKYESASAGMSTGYRLYKFIYSSGSIYATRRLAGNSGYQRNSYSASVGLTFAPGEIPISLW